MLVRNCYAESNDNFRVLVIDENGFHFILLIFIKLID